jgi:hypothetical protein
VTPGVSRPPPDAGGAGRREHPSCLPVMLGVRPPHRATRWVRRLRQLAVGVAVAVGGLLLGLKGTGLPNPYSRADVTMPPPPTSAPSEGACDDVRGTIAFINRLTRTVRIATPDGSVVRDTMLRVTDDTRIHVPGRRGSFTDLREGDPAAALYESRAQINVATSIDVGQTERWRGPVGSDGCRRLRGPAAHVPSG